MRRRDGGVGCDVLLLGVAFDCLTHNVGAWVSEAL